MERIEMNEASLELFIKRFLPEGRMLNEPSLELDRIARTLYVLFETDDYPTFITTFFELLFKLQYPMSVIEPLRQTDVYKPYIETNSRSIYIATTLDKILEIEKLSIILSENDPVIPCGLKELYNAIHQFVNDKP